MRARNPNGAPHAGELLFVFDTLATLRVPGDGGAAPVSPEDQRFADLDHACWVAFAKAPVDATRLDCGGRFIWPARSGANDHAAAWLSAEPRVVPAASLRSPPNGAEPGPTWRDEKSE